MANRVRIKARGLAAIFGGFSVRQSTGAKNGKSLNVQNLPVTVKHVRGSKA